MRKQENHKLLNVIDLHFHYPGVNRTISDINFSVSSGEFVGIIGPNSSGKSTLLNCISRVLNIQKGDIVLDNKNIRKWNSKKLAQFLAVVPQDTLISFDYSCFDVVLMGRSPFLGKFQLEGPEDYEIAHNSMKLTDTWYLKDKSINEVSGGERQRVILARALAQNPKLLLLDEPTSHLDINHQVELLDLLVHLNESENLSILWVSHDLNLAAEYCKKLILMDQGTIFQIGTPHDVIQSDIIHHVYGAKVTVSRNPITNSPMINLLPQKFSNIEQ